jgi:integrase/recombinase XerD
MPASFDTIIEDFVANRTSASSESTANRHARDIRNQWRPWVESETSASIWTAEYGEVARYLRHLDREGYAEGTRELRYLSINLFYDELWKMDLEGGHDLPEAVVERIERADSIEEFNPANEIDKSDFGISGESTNKKHAGRGPNEVPYLTPDQVEDVEEATNSLRDCLIVRMLYTTGLRRTELVKLRVDYVDRVSQSIDVPAVKGDEGRRVPYPDRTEDLLREWLDYSGRKAQPGASSSPYLFPSDSQRGHYAPNSVGRMIKKAGDKTPHQEVVATYADGREMHKVGPHALRHSYGVQAVKSGVGIKQLSDLMGHSDLDTTKRYLQIAERDTIEHGRRFDTGY